MPLNPHNRLAAFDAIALVDLQVSDLRVVLVDAGMRERIQHGLEVIVRIATAAIGRIELNGHGQRTLQRLTSLIRERPTNALPKLAAFAANQRSLADMSPVAVDTGRKGKN